MFSEYCPFCHKKLSLTSRAEYTADQIVICHDCLFAILFYGQNGCLIEIKFPDFYIIFDQSESELIVDFKGRNYFYEFLDLDFSSKIALENNIKILLAFQ